MRDVGKVEGKRGLRADRRLPLCNLCRADGIGPCNEDAVAGHLCIRRCCELCDHADRAHAGFVGYCRDAAELQLGGKSGNLAGLKDIAVCADALFFALRAEAGGCRGRPFAKGVVEACDAVKLLCNGAEIACCANGCRGMQCGAVCKGNACVRGCRADRFKLADRAGAPGE